MEKELSSHILRNQALYLLGIVVFSFGIILSLLFDISLFFSLALGTGILGLILFFVHPPSLMALLVIVRMSLDAFTPLFSLTLFDVVLSPSQLLGIAIAGFGLPLLFVKYKELSHFSLVLPFLILFIWGSMTLSYSLSLHDTLQDLLRFFDLFILSFLTFLAVQKSEDYRKLLIVFFISSLIPIIFALYQFIFSIGFHDEAVSIPRIFGTLSHPNVFSLYLFSLIVYTLLFTTLFSRQYSSRVMAFILLGIFSIVLLLTFARVAWVTLFIFTFLLALFRLRALLIPLIMIPLILFVFSTNIQERVIDSFILSPDSSIVWRQNLWYDITTTSMQDGNMWFGSGMNTFPLVAEGLYGNIFGVTDAHNDFVKFFIEGGIVGVAVYCLYIGSIFLLLIKKYKSQKESRLQLAFGIMLLLFLSLIVAGLSDNVFKNTPVQWLFFIALGGLLALADKKE